MKQNTTKFLNFIVIFVLTSTLQISFCFSQGKQHHHQRPVDPRYSVFGSPRPAVWEFQASAIKDDGESVSSFNFYRKNQRNKTIFLRVMDNGLNIRRQYRIKQLTGGAILFPYKDDDRLQLDLGGVYDALEDTSLTNKTFFSRITFRPKPFLWFRVGYESFGGFTISDGHIVSYPKGNSSSRYIAGRVNVHKFSVLGVTGAGKIDDVSNTRYGAGGLFKGPYNTYMFGGWIKSTESLEDVRTLAAGRWAPFRPDNLPSGFFIWKHRDSYDFQLGGIFWGGENMFVRPAAIGMTQGIFISSMALRENTQLRQAQLMSITDDYRNANFSVFYVYLNQGVEMMPNQINHVGFRVIQLYHIFNDIKLSFISKPVTAIFYNEETEPKFSTKTYSLVDETNKFWSYQIGVTLFDRFVFNVIQVPSKSDWTIALSYICR